jgi:hypothetical protein
MSGEVMGQNAQVGIEFTRVVDDMVEAMPVVRSMNPPAEVAGRRNTAASGLRALLDAGYTVSRAAPSPERDTERLVEAGNAMARAILDLRMHEGRAAWDAAEIARDKWLSEKS